MAVYAAVKERIFARSWQLIGDSDLARAPGQLYPFTLLEGCLDEPMLLTRDMDDELHCLSNVCTHRGNLVVENPGNERFLRCRYHGRRFGLNGCFQHMPEFEKAADFPTERDNLPRVPFGSFGKLLFASIDPAFTLEEYLVPLASRVGWMPLREFTFDAARSKDYLVRANWALYCDNYMEGFHIPFIHPTLAPTLDFGKYHTERFRYGTLEVGVAGGGQDSFDLPPESPDYGQEIAAYYFWLFPNTMFNFYPWGVSVNVVRPIGIDLTRVSFLSYVWDKSRLGVGAGADLDRVEREDEVVVEAVQRGVRSRLYDRGRYSPTREQAIHHFHRLALEFLNP
jgi:choline monooxygenase